MRKLVLVLSLLLAGCAGTLPSLNLNTTVSRNTLLGIESAYGIALSGERTYKNLCKSKAITGSCKTIVVQLQAADKKAIQAIRDAVRFMEAYPTVDSSNVLQAAQNAVAQLQSILSTNGVS